MTTTAEKIDFVLEKLWKANKDKSDPQSSYADSILEFFGLSDELRLQIFAKVFKDEMPLAKYIEGLINIPPAPGPEPMEGGHPHRGRFWVNYYGPEFKTCAYHSFMAAVEARSPGGSTIPVRKITPQDEQDRKDAVRYRKAKKISCNMTVNVSQWDQIIDKAIV